MGPTMGGQLVDPPDNLEGETRPQRTVATPLSNQVKMISVLDFSPKFTTFFLQMTTFFSKPMDCSMKFADPRTKRRTGPILS